MKAKNILTPILSILMGLLCDWALIHNFLWQTSLNVYYQRYIHFYEFLSWVVVVGLTLIATHLALYKRYPQCRSAANLEFTKELALDHKPRLWKRIYRYFNTCPMILFAAIFVGDISLTIVWTIALIMICIAENVAEGVSKIIEETDALEASMKSKFTDKT